METEEKTFGSALGGILSAKNPTPTSRLSTRTSDESNMDVQEAMPMRINERLGVFHERFAKQDIFTEHEELLLRVATKGVVRLFNSLEKHGKLKQRDIEIKRKEKERIANKAKEARNNAAATPSNAPRWSVLRDTFLQAEKQDIADWNKTDI